MGQNSEMNHQEYNKVICESQEHTYTLYYTLLLLNAPKMHKALYRTSHVQTLLSSVYKSGFINTETILTPCQAAMQLLRFSEAMTEVCFQF